MDTRFRHYLKVTTIVHFAVVLLLIVAPLILNWRIRKKNRETMTFIDLTVSMPEIPAAMVAPAVKAPEPEKQDIPEPPKKPRVKKSQKIIKRPEQKKPPVLSPEEIRKLLAAGAKVSDRAAMPTDEFPFAWYYALVRQTMYDAWNQPSGTSVAPGLTAEVTIRVQKDGTISQRRMTRASGNAVMDESVMKAVQAVPRLRELPPQFGGAYKDIVILFELTRGGA